MSMSTLGQHVATEHVCCVVRGSLVVLGGHTEGTHTTSSVAMLSE